MLAVKKEGGVFFVVDPKALRVRVPRGLADRALGLRCACGLRGLLPGKPAGILENACGDAERGLEGGRLALRHAER
jgi:hypothetical protein